MKKSLFEYRKEIKEKHPDALIMLRDKDNYLLLDDDAKTASKILGIALQKGESGDYTEYPFYKIDQYLPKLIRHGYRIAICEAI